MSTPKQSAYSDDESRWQAVVRRDRNADGAFYFAVRTTGVYCRPSCPSRGAKRGNVRFFPTCEQAELAGFRPCKRCRPNVASPSEQQRDAVAQVCRILENADEVPRLADLAESAGMSRFHFQRLFKSIIGVTPKTYAAALRTERVRNELTEGATVTEAIHGAGFNSSGRFYANSTERLGMTPTAFRNGGDGMTIRFAVGPCSLGNVLVGATDKGVCAIFLGNDPDELVRNLQDRFPKAHLVAGEKAFDRWVAQVVGLVEQPALGLDLPLDIRGTAFQVSVWEALRKIPAGTTMSYAEIAERIGRPTAARAVAQACAANPIAIVIPCHRVVRTDESLSGYRWGVERKAELIERERKAETR